jgi:hypothetical protein
MAENWGSMRCFISLVSITEPQDDGNGSFSWQCGCNSGATPLTSKSICGPQPLAGLHRNTQGCTPNSFSVEVACPDPKTERVVSGGCLVSTLNGPKITASVPTFPSGYTSGPATGWRCTFDPECPSQSSLAAVVLCYRLTGL